MRAAGPRSFPEPADRDTPSGDSLDCRGSLQPGGKGRDDARERQPSDAEKWQLERFLLRFGMVLIQREENNMKSRFRRGAHAAVCAAACATLPAAASGATITWTNPGTGSWFAGANWDAGVPPALGDEAVVNDGGTAQSTDAGDDIEVAHFRFGVTNVAGANVEGRAEIAGGLGAQLGSLVGALSSGNGSSATGHLTVGGTLRGLGTVGRADNAPGGAASVANGTVVAGHLVSSMPLLQVGVGIGSGATGIGTVDAASVESIAGSLESLLVGYAAGGIGQGSLSLDAGTLDVGTRAYVGYVTDAARGTARGELLLGGTLRAQPGTDAVLRVGAIEGRTFEVTGPGSAEGSLRAHGVESFGFVEIGGTILFGTQGDTATGSASIGSGGIVNKSVVPGGQVRVGVAEVVPLNNVVSGPGGDVTGSASVAGDIAGYDRVSVGRVVNAGRADGSLTVSSGTVGTRSLDVGVVDQPSAATPVTDPRAEAVGRMSVTDGEVVLDPLGSANVGVMIRAPERLGDYASGTLELARSNLNNGFLRIGIGTADGTLTADASGIDVINVIAGSAGGTANVRLRDSTLRIRETADWAGSGSMLIGSNGGTGTFSATGGSIDVARDLVIAIGSTAPSTDGQLSLLDSALTVGGSVGIGSFNPTSRGRLSLTNSVADVGLGFFLGGSANDGTLFGEAALQIDASLLTIGEDLRIDAGAAPGVQVIFGVGGTMRGHGGYGAIDIGGGAWLAGQLLVDFAELDPYAIGSGFDFDLIFASSGFSGDFDSVSFANLGAGYVVRSYGIVDVGHSEVWRVTLAAATVPVPATLPLLLLGGLLIAVRARRS